MPASLTIFEKEHEAREKYIYFVCGLVGALVAYIGKDYFPEYPLTIRAKLTMWAMASLTLCLVTGLAQIQVYIKGLSTNKDHAIKDEEIENHVRTLVQHQANLPILSINTKTAKPRNILEIQNEIESLKVKRAKDFKSMERWFLASKLLFIACHAFLVIGFILLILSKFRTN